jgi:uncharacterized repeat protein (TIGR02543 family)
MKRIILFAILPLLFTLLNLPFTLRNAHAATTWQQTNGPYGDDIQAIAIDHSSTQTVYVGTPGGVLKSVNGGGNWSAVNTGLIGFSVISLAIDPATPQTIFAGTGSGGGVFKSDNGGASWSAVNTGLTSASVSSLAIDLATPQTIYAANGAEGVFKSVNGGGSWSAVNFGLIGVSVQSLAINPSTPQTVYAGSYGGGVFKSVNGGVNWSTINNGLYDTGVSSLAISSDGIIYAGTSGGVYKSTNGGASWSAANTGLANTNVHTLAIDSSTSPQTIYAGTEGGVFKSDINIGANWSAVNSGLTNLSVYSLAVDLTTPQTIYAGTWRGGVFKSNNSGAAWSAVNTGLTGLSIQSLAIDPTTPQTVYAATYYGGVFKSVNGGGSWNTINSGLSTNTNVYSLAIDPSTPLTVYAGTFGGAFKSVNGGASWSTINTGLTSTYVFSLAISPTTSLTIYAGTSGGVFKSTNSGANWSAINSGLSNLSIRSLIIDPSTPQTIYAGTLGGVFKSVNGGANWSAVNTGLTNLSVRSLVFDPSTSLTLYAGTMGGVFMSIDGGGSWSAVNTGLTNLSVYSLAIDPSSPQAVYAATWGGGVFKSINAGSSWSGINSGLANNFAWPLAIDPTAPQTMYAGTSGGVFKILLGAFEFLTVSKSGTGNGDVTSSPANISCGVTCSAAFASGTLVALTATSDSGSTFTGWSGACSGTGTCTVTMDATKNVGAEFTAKINGACGSANNQTYTIAPTSNPCTPDAVVSLTPTATGWSWICSGTNGGTPASCSANIQAYAVNFQSGGNGTLTGTASQTINYGASATAVTAVPATGYHFVNWTGTGGFVTTTANPLTVSNVTAAQTITANFVIDTFGVNFAAGSNGSLTGTISQTINYGASATAVTAVPATGYHFVNWTGTGGFVTSTANPLTVSNVTAAQTITANFAIDTFAVNFAAGSNGTLTGTTSQTINYGASATAVTAVPTTGYHFVNWTGTGGFVTTTANPLTVSNITAAQTITANFAIDTFVVNFTSGGNGTLTGTASQTINYGASATAVTAVPATGYHFVNWTGTGGFVTSTANPLTVSNVTATQTITANFAIDTFGVNFAAGSNGSLTGTISQTINYGASASAVTAVPAIGYHFVNWTGTGGFVTSTANPLTVSNVTAAQTISANFAIDTFAVNFAAGSNGSLTGTASQTINYGASATAVTAVPTTGYHFVNWTGTGGFVTSTANPLTVSNVTAAQTITVNFAIDTFAVVFVSGGNGTLTGTTSQTINYGASATAITAVPAIGYHFVNWTGTGGFVTSTANPLTVSNVTAAQTITVNFAIDTFAVEFVSGGNGTLTGTTSQTINYGASAIAVTAVPATGYHFVNWTGTGGFVTTSANPLTVSNVTATQTITANFAIDTFVVNFTSGGNGTLTGTASQTINYGASAIAVTAVPATGYHFVNWTGTGGLVTTTANPLTVSNVTATQTITANFAIDTFAVNFTSGGNGTLIGTMSQTVNYGASASAVSAVPATGYHFVNWTGTGGFVTSTANPLTVSNVTAAQTISANFAIDTFAVNFAAGSNGSLTGTTSQTINYGASATAVTAVPTTGYHFVNWTGTGGFVTSTANPLTVSNVIAAQTITVNFAIDTFAVEFVSGGNGTLTGTTSQTINYGASASAVTAVPTTGYHFVNWTGTGGFVTTSANPLTVSNVTAAQTITANFAIDTFVVNFTSGDNGTVSCTSPVNYGATSTCTVTPASGYQLATFSDNNVDKTGSVAGGSYSIANVTANHTITATFSQIPPTPVNGACGTSNGGTFTAIPSTNYCTSGTATAVTGTGPWSWTCSGTNGGATATCSANIQTWIVSASVTGGNGSISCISPVNSGDSSICTINHLAGYALGTLTDNSTDVKNQVSAATYTISNVAANHTVIGTFVDTNAPSIKEFSIPATETSLSVPVTTLAATDDVGVIGYLISESAIQPQNNDQNWSPNPPTQYVFTSQGTKTLYAFAKDAAGNISIPLSATVTITLPDTIAPVVTLFTLPATETNLTVPVTALAATDAVGVAGYLISESANQPQGNDQNWSANPPTQYVFASQGVKTLYAFAKDAAGNISAPLLATATITLPDTTAPVVTDFTISSNATNLTVPVSTLVATDSVGVAAYLVSESDRQPQANDQNWSVTLPTQFAFTSQGAKTLYAFAKDAAGNISAPLSANVTITLADTTAPVVSSFTIPATATNLTVPVSSFTASDAVGVNGYCLSETITAPLLSDSHWTTTPTSSFTFASAGSKTLYAFAKDAAGNISSPVSAVVTITLPDITVPTVTVFTMPTTATSLTVPVTIFAANDNTAVTGYILTETATAPLVNISGWTSTAPNSYTFRGAGSLTLYAFVKDAAGNVSVPVPASITISLPDTSAPTVTTFVIPATSSSLTVSVTTFTATDNVAVTGYLLSEVSSSPQLTAQDWTSTPTGSYTFSAVGSKTLYAFAKDAAGNISPPVSGSVVITFPAIVGVCGSSDGQIFTLIPTNNLCNIGTATNVTGTGPWYWSCNGTNGETTASCSASIQTWTVSDSVTGSNGTVSCTTPVNNGLTSTCTVTPVNGYQLATFSDNSIDKKGSVAGGSYSIANVTTNHIITATFSQIPQTQVNGACGTSNGGTFTLIPSTNYCTSGTATSVTGTGPWSWTCTGINGGATVTCSANIAASTPTQFTVTPTTGSGFSIVPATPQTVTNNGTTAFNVTPASGYGILSVTGCGGSLNGNIYTTGPITANCSVSVTAVARTATSGSTGGTSSQPTISDALKVLQSVVGTTQLTAQEKIRYDVAPLDDNNKPVGNGTVDIVDVIMILRRSIGMENW